MKGGTVRKSGSVRCLTLLLAMGTWLATSPMATAQVLYGSIVGTVLDPSNAVIPNATVTIASAETGAVRETRADEGGRYSLVNVLPGTYSLKVTADGFRTVTREGVQVTINMVTRVDMRLEVGLTTEQITVAATGALLQTDKSDVRTEISSREISNLPLSNYRNFQSLLNLVPGATPTNFQHLGDAIGRALGTNMNGTAMNNNRTRVDGATNVFIWLPQHLVYVPPVESIDTVNVTTGSFDAEQGMAGGAAMTVATKSGTNELHGVAYHYHDNQHLYARNFFCRPTRVKPSRSSTSSAGPWAARSSGTSCSSSPAWSRPGNGPAFPPRPTPCPPRPSATATSAAWAPPSTTR